MSSARELREQRRTQLIERIARERGEIAQLALRLQAPVRRAEQVTQKTQYVFKHFAALWVPLAALVLMRFRPRRAVGFMAKMLRMLPILHVARRLRRWIPWMGSERRSSTATHSASQRLH
jgi:hypothetical protein